MIWAKILPPLLAVIGLALLLLGLYNWAAERGARPWRAKYHEYVATIAGQDAVAKQHAQDREREQMRATNALLMRQAADAERLGEMRRNLVAGDDRRDQRLRDAVTQLHACRVRGVQMPAAATEAQAPTRLPTGSTQRPIGASDPEGITVFRKRIEQLNLDYEACRSYVESLP